MRTPGAGQRGIPACQDPHAAISALERAYEQPSGCGALRRLDEAARELRKLGRAVPRAGRGRRADSPALGLTARELEVLEHVAALIVGIELIGRVSCARCG
jgi:hypothetical protein